MEVVILEKFLNFKINTCIPKNNLAFDNEDIKVSEAIYTIFPLETEDAVLFWGKEQILLSYRYDISTMIDDIIQMIFNLKNQNVREWSVDWPSNTFACNWKIKWINDSLEIVSNWREEFNATEYLRKNNVIKIGKTEFLNEWKNIIDILIHHLTECGYNNQNLLDMGLLLKSYSLLKD